MQIALADALNLADERTEGRMRALIEDTGEQLASMLEDPTEATVRSAHTVSHVCGRQTATFAGELRRRGRVPSRRV